MVPTIRPPDARWKILGIQIDQLGNRPPNCSNDRCFQRGMETGGSGPGCSFFGGGSFWHTHFKRSDEIQKTICRNVSINDNSMVWSLPGIFGNIFMVRIGCKLKTICLDVIHLYMCCLYHFCDFCHRKAYSKWPLDMDILILFSQFLDPPEMMVSVLRAGVLKDVFQFASNSFGLFYGSFDTPNFYGAWKLWFAQLLILMNPTVHVQLPCETKVLFAGGGSCISCYHHEDGVRLSWKQKIWYQNWVPWCELEIKWEGCGWLREMMGEDVLFWGWVHLLL